MVSEVYDISCALRKKNHSFPELKLKATLRERTLGSSPNVLCSKLKVREASSQLSRTKLEGLQSPIPPSPASQKPAGSQSAENKAALGEATLEAVFSTCPTVNAPDSDAFFLSEPALGMPSTLYHTL